MTRSAGTCVTKFADYQLGLYATADYLAMHGRITGLANLHEHTLIGYVDAVLDVLPLRILDELVPEKRAQIKPTTSPVSGLRPVPAWVWPLFRCTPATRIEV